MRIRKFCPAMMFALALLICALCRAEAKAFSISLPSGDIGVAETRALSVEGASGGATYTSSDEGVLLVSENGELTGVKTGKATVTAVDGAGNLCKLAVAVRNGPVALSLSHKSATLSVGNAGILAVKVNAGASSSVSFASSAPEIASVDAYGQVIGLSPGEATISVSTYNGLTDACVVTVYPAPESLRVIAARTVMGAGDNYMASCETVPENALCRVTYSSGNDAVLSVSAEGKVIARKAGQASIIATADNGVTGEIAVEVRARPTAVKITAPHNPMGAGETMALNVAFPGDQYGAVAFRSDNTKVLTVDENGVVTAISRGSANVYARTYNGCSHSVAIYVKNPPEDVSVSARSVSLGAGDTFILSADISKGYGGYSFASMDEGVCAVTDDGLITAVSPGTAEVICTTYNGLSDTCLVSVYPAPESMAAEITLDVLGVGERAYITASLSPADTRAPILYSSSDSSVVEADASGALTAKKAGEAVISAYAYNGVKKEFSVRVLAAPKAITIACERSVLTVGERCALSYSLSEGAAGQAALSCDNLSALGYEDGYVVALAPGVARVTATAYNGVSAVFEITVAKAPEWIAFGAEEYWLNAGQIVSADILVPEGAYAELRYTCEGNACALLADGRLIALREGVAEVTAYCQAQGVTATARVRVLAGAQGQAIDLRASGLSAEACAEMQVNNPDLLFLWEMTVFGQKMLSTDTELRLKNRNLSDMDAIKRALDALPNLKYLDLSYNNFSNEALAALREEYRARTKIVWTVDIYRWSIRTDDTAFSTLLDDYSLKHSSKEFEPLKYCEDMVALDLGHNAIKDLTFLLSLPKLKILILSVNYLTDITLLGQLTNLEYLELFTNEISDVSALSSLENLIDLNLSNNDVDDITPLLGLPKLERLWMTHNQVSASEIAQLKEAHPNCEMNFDAPGPDRRGWRSHQRYFVIYQIFHTNVYVPWDADVEPAPNWRAYY